MRELSTAELWERLKALRDKLARLVRSGKRGKLRDWRVYNLICRILMRRNQLRHRPRSFSKNGV